MSAMNLLILLLFIPATVLSDIEPGLVKYRQQVIDQHNIFRSQCSADNLQESSVLNKKAQDWCEDMAARNQFNHSGTIEYGENSYQKIPFDSQNDNGATPVTAWYSERAKYDPANPSTGLHFSQVVWKNTKNIGVGVCRVQNGGLNFVVNYSPRGNYEGQFAANVLCKS